MSENDNIMKRKVGTAFYKPYPSLDGWFIRGEWLFMKNGEVWFHGYSSEKPYRDPIKEQAWREERDNHVSGTR